MQDLDMAYCTVQAKASLGTAAHLAMPLVSTTSSMTTTTAPSSSTTTIRKPCPAEQVLGSNSPQLENLRLLRDSSLAQSSAGRRIMSLYYNNAESINAALESCPALQATARWLLESIAPILPNRKVK